MTHSIVLDFDQQTEQTTVTADGYTRTVPEPYGYDGVLRTATMYAWMGWDVSVRRPAGTEAAA